MRSSSADSAHAPWRREHADGSVTLEFRCQPGAKRTEVAGVHGEVLRIRVAAPPIEGRANEALRHFLADAFGVPLRNVVLVRGEGGRRKTLRILFPAARPDRDWAAS